MTIFTKIFESPPSVGTKHSESILDDPGCVELFAKGILQSQHPIFGNFTFRTFHIRSNSATLPHQRGSLKKGKELTNEIYKFRKI